MNTNLDRRVGALEDTNESTEGMTTITFVTGETCQVQSGFFKAFFGEKRPPGGTALPILDDSCKVL